MLACTRAMITRAAARHTSLLLIVGVLIMLSRSAAHATPIDQPSRITVDPRSRQAALDFFRSHYLPVQQAAIEWTGDDATCTPGTTAPTFRAATLQRINYYRAMAGIPADVSFAEQLNQKAQQAALMMLANRQLDHTPPQDWKCYSPDGAAAAGSSNLSLGSFGATAIDRQMRDAGASNYFVGHRRWLLYPQTETMGTGDVVTAHALWVIDDKLGAPRPATRDNYVAWPPQGYVPHAVVFPRWSFGYPGADFRQARVSMTENGVPIPVDLEKAQDGFGENTLVWIPLDLEDNDAWPRPTTDTPYIVTITDVLIDGTPRQFSYTVTVFDAESTMSTSNSTPAPTPVPPHRLTKQVFVPFLRR